VLVGWCVWSRLARFNEEWPTLEKWFCELSVLKLVDASAEPDDVAAAVDAIVAKCLATDAAALPQVHCVNGPHITQHQIRNFGDILPS